LLVFLAEFLSIFLQSLYEAFTEYSFLQTGKACAFAHQNDVNLNIIIEDKAENGIVYKNDVEKFKLMKVEDIVDLSMNKLHKQLTIFHDEIKNNNTFSLNNKLLLNEKESLDEKYNNFKNENDTKILVKNYIADIYNKQKDRTLNYCKDVLYDEISKIEGY
jgi:hypothetical protein